MIQFTFHVNHKNIHGWGQKPERGRLAAYWNNRIEHDAGTT
jgi:hypothetical protein